MSNPYFQFKQFIIHQDRCAMKVTTDACLFGAWVAEEDKSKKAKGKRKVAEAVRQSTLAKRKVAGALRQSTLALRQVTLAHRQSTLTLRKIAWPLRQFA
jgi:tRNA1Val (adenine37-N6)-methyltransferase